MTVHVTLNGHLHHFTSSGDDEHLLDLPEDATVASALAQLGIPTTDVFSALLDGRSVPFSEPLCKEGRLELLPAISGG